MIARSTLRQITRHYPLNRPRRRLIEMLPSVATDNGEFSIKSGLRLRAYPGGEDHICKQAYWFGDFDPWVDRTLARLARPGDTAIDVGANIGTTTLCLARSVGAAGRVIAFEPLPSNSAMLRSNIEANKFQQVEVWSRLYRIKPAEDACWSRKARRARRVWKLPHKNRGLDPGRANGSR